MDFEAYKEITLSIAALIAVQILWRSFEPLIKRAFDSLFKSKKQQEDITKQATDISFKASSVFEGLVLQLFERMDDRDKQHREDAIQKSKEHREDMKELFDIFLREIRSFRDSTVKEFKNIAERDENIQETLKHEVITKDNYNSLKKDHRDMHNVMNETNENVKRVGKKLKVNFSNI
jgi:hypothetical protein